MTDPYILKMRPYLRKKVWGGRKLADLFGKELPDASPYGEAWEVADLAEGESTITNGPLAGQKLSDAVELWGQALCVGSADGVFPLLVKLLDAQDDLSVQVHPGEDDIARLGLDADSKDECWLILQADDGGCILHGFEQATTADDFRTAVEENRAADVLRRVPVQAGDVIRVAPGTIHAICKGVCLLEIQQPSDTTYRVYDYDRPGMDGKPRELHLADAMRVANFDAHPPCKLACEPSSVDGVEVLVDVDAYRIERLLLHGQRRWHVDTRTPQVVYAADGSLRLSGTTGSIELAPGQTSIIPAGIGDVRVSSSAGEADIIAAGLGGAPIIGS